MEDNGPTTEYGQQNKEGKCERKKERLGVGRTQARKRKTKEKTKQTRRQKCVTET